ncbi:unnamed protein product [Cuscuta campestris]|uniref:PHD-type domain-containing protein n=1 Tax=Cuscuta campestris TaxID=132261 RepID=A0A484LMR8_9ASTE|nr:unnamed protein product [Cuscuta campestris]
MVDAAGKVERRGRKRRKADVQSVEVDHNGKKRRVSTRSKVLVGRYVRKEFEGSGVFLGKIMSYDSGLYRVNYEDGDCEDLDSNELKGVLVEQDVLDGNWLERKRMLDELVFSKEITAIGSQVENAIFPKNLTCDNMPAVDHHAEKTILPMSANDENVLATECDVENALNAVVSMNVADDSVISTDFHVENASPHMNVSDTNGTTIDCQVESASPRMNVTDIKVTAIDCQDHNGILLVNETENNVTAPVSNVIIGSLGPCKVEAVQGDDNAESINEIDNYMTAPVPNVVVGSLGPCKVEAGQVDDNAESMSDYSDDDDVMDLISNVVAPAIPPPDLPLSSGNIGVPEEYVSYLLSVYSFLRSFSTRLFLSPFGLDDFVGSVNCPTPSTLFDSIHLALMRTLRQHLEKLSSDGSEFASKCLRNLDWSLLDSMTWPIYLVHYLLLMRYLDGPDWKGFGSHVMERDYYTLTVGQKLMILQIMCDDALDAEEVRAEMDMREASEFGTDSEGIAAVPLNGPRRVHPRYSKTSAFKQQETMEIIAKGRDIRSSHTASSLTLKVSSDAVIDADQDGNGDECRLCGMDGTLLCCDGCPSSYHARCIGVCKMYMRDENWYCPECRINKLRPTTIRGTSLRGAQLFGVDFYGLIFVGCCDHLLVLQDPMNSGSCFRYYNETDISRVLHSLTTNVQYKALYSEICKGIVEYWGIPANALDHSGVVGLDIGLTNREEISGCSVPSLATLLGKESNFSENFASCAAEMSSETMQFRNDSKELMLNEGSGRANQPECDGVDVRHNSANINCMPLCPGQPTIFTGSGIQQANLSRKTQEDYSGLIETASCTSRNSCDGIGYNSEYCAGVLASECGNFHEGRGEKNLKISTEGRLYTGSSFKAHGYLNYYLHGDFAASAAASLALFSSEENQGSESHSLEKRRRLMSADVQLQIKAFSSVATRFFWPNTEKKLIEVPRERCSWCLSCKAPVASKKACLLNAAVSNATKGAMKILATIRPAKIEDGNLPGVAAYIILMEESLRGLTVGPFLNADFRKHWRTQAEEATSCYTIKSLLLELEENIRMVALCADWVKFVDGCSSEPAVAQSVTSVPGSSHKRKPGKRGRKPCVVADASVDHGQDKSTDFTWWSGGMLSKFMFQRGTLPQSMVKKAAYEGGRRKIPGIYYSEGSETPKRNRRLVWRAAVEMCKTASHLALQVRYLDMHVRWSDLVRPEPTLLEGKGADTEASAFRNALICDKGKVENEMRYGVAFGNQKHLSSRVMKSVLEIGKRQDGKEMYWFSESRVPLYLIKEYEIKLLKNLPSSAADKPVNAFSKQSRKWSRTVRGDVFTYLACKRDGDDKRSCAVCQVDVFLRNGIICCVCQGLCHEQCTTSSTANPHYDSLCIIRSCKQCHQNSSVAQCAINNESPNSPLLLQGQEFPNADTARKGGMLSSCKRLSSSSRGNVRSSDVKPNGNSHSKAKLKTLGVIWKKPSAIETDIDFINKHILRKGGPVNGSGPSCQLCQKPYNPDLMYIHCEKCQHWYHADAVELDESKICDVMGFKCCRCRRIRIPICPYLDQESKKQLMEKRTRSRPSKVVEDPGMDSDSGTVVSSEPRTPIVVPLLQEEETVDTDFLCSLSSMEKTTKQNPQVYCKQEVTAPLSIGRGTKKLPIRRHTKREDNSDSFGEDNKAVTTCGADNSNAPAEEGVVLLNCDGLSYEDMEFEPQTYFSFNELLLEFDMGNAMPKTESPSSLAVVAAEEPAEAVVPCMVCSHADPAPTLCCETCGIWIHRHCSPWFEELSDGSFWKCGTCREWR